MDIIAYYPCKVSRRITSPFGPRALSSDGFHDGVDFGADMTDEPILASYDGTVVRSYLSSSYGNCIIIDHGGYCTLYAHLKSRSVSVNAKVTAGQEIGIMGSTGHSTGVHLHYEVRDTSYDRYFWDKNDAGNCRKNAIDPESVLTEYPEDSVIETWAQEAMEWAWENGITNDQEPDVNKQETIVMLYRYNSL